MGVTVTFTVFFFLWCLFYALLLHRCVLFVCFLDYVAVSNTKTKQNPLLPKALEIDVWLFTL